MLDILSCMGVRVHAFHFWNSMIVPNSKICLYIVASHLQRGSAIRWREDIEMDVAKISGGSLQPGRLYQDLSDTIDG